MENMDPDDLAALGYIPEDEEEDEEEEAVATATTVTSDQPIQQQDDTSSPAPSQPPDEAKDDQLTEEEKVEQFTVSVSTKCGVDHPVSSAFPFPMLSKCCQKKNSLPFLAGKRNYQNWSSILVTIVRQPQHK